MKGLDRVIFVGGAVLLFMEDGGCEGLGRWRIKNEVIEDSEGLLVWEL